MASSVAVVRRIDTRERSLPKREINSLLRASFGTSPGNLFGSWHSLSHVAYLAYDDRHRLAAVAFFRHLAPGIVFEIGSAVHPACQRTGWTVRLAARAVARSLVYRAVCAPWRVHTPALLLARTRNPRVYRLLSDRFRVYPSPSGTPATNRERRALRLLGHCLSTDLESGLPVVKDCYANSPALVASIDSIPWSQRKHIDDWMDEILGLRISSFDALVICATIPLGGLFYETTRMLHRAQVRASIKASAGSAPR
jgi:hypothetical protein